MKIRALFFIALAACGVLEKVLPRKTANAQLPGRGPALDRLVELPADPDVPRAVAQKATWCSKVEKPGTPGALARRLEGARDGGWHWGVLEQIAGDLCASSGADYQEQTRHVLQDWINLTGLTQAEIVESIEVRLDRDAWERDRTALCKRVAPGPEAETREEVLGKAELAAYGCGHSAAPAWFDATANDPGALDWWLDTGPATEVLKASRVLACLRDPGTAEVPPDLMLRFALCGAEARSLDRARLDQELAGATPFQRIMAREHHGRARLIGARLARHADALAAKDPAWKAILVDAPARAAAVGRDLPAGLAALEQQLETKAKPAATACEPLRAALSQKLGKVSGGDVPAVELALAEVTATRIRLALSACVGRQGDRWSSFQLGYGIAGERLARGPRVATYYEVLDAISAAREERPKFPANPQSLSAPDVPDFRDTLAGIWGSMPLDGATQGVVASVKQVDGGVLVGFETVATREPKLECKDTNRILKVDSDGRVTYRQDCKRIGTEIVRRTAPAIFLSPGDAAGIARGHLVRFRPDALTARAGGRRAVIEAVWTDGEAKTLRNVRGIPFVR